MPSKSPDNGISAEEELEELKKAYNLLEGDRKAYYETSQFTIKQNRDLIEQLRKELQDLRATQNSRKNGTGEAAALNDESDHWNEQLCLSKKKYDDLKHLAASKQKEILQLQDKLGLLVQESRKPSAEDTPMMKQIRVLENRLDKAMIKYNEAQSIRKTYEQIVKRLKEERVGFDTQLAGIEKTLKAKEADYAELLLLSHDANHAKEVALNELHKFEQAMKAEKDGRKREVEEKRATLQARTETLERLEQKERARRREAEDSDKNSEDRLKKSNIASSFQHAIAQSQLETERQKIADYEEAFRRIKEATGVSDVNEVIQKFLTQEDTQNNLMELTREHQSRIEALNEERGQLRSKVEELKYSGSQNMQRRQIVDDFESLLTEATNRCERNRVKYERLSKIIVNVKAGIEHLFEKLEHIKLENQPNLIPSDDNIVEILSQCDNKIAKLIADLGEAGEDEDDEDEEEETLEDDDSLSGSKSPSKLKLMASFPAQDDLTLNNTVLSEHNVRIKLPEATRVVPVKDDGSEDDDVDDEIDDEVMNRDRVKHNAQSMLEKQQKKTKRAKKKGSKRDDESTSRR